MSIEHILAELREQRTILESIAAYIVPKEPPSDGLRVGKDDFPSMLATYIDSSELGDIREMYSKSLPFIDSGVIFVNESKFLDYIQSEGKFLDVTRKDIGELFSVFGWGHKRYSRRYNGRTQSREYWRLNIMAWRAMMCCPPPDLSRWNPIPKANR